jgi:hypothetical protein
VSAFADFHRLVLEDPRLQDRLRAERDWDRFVSLACRLAAERGSVLSGHELEQARRAARRAWIERRL